MSQMNEMRQWSAIAGLGALLCYGTVIAQGVQSALPAGGKTQAPFAVPDNSGADAAAFSKMNAGKLDDAVAAFQAVLAAKPNDAGALAGMGQVRMLQGNYLGAVSFLEQAKQANPDDATITAALDSARFQFLMGEGKDAVAAKDSVEAEKCYREALKLRPNERQAVDALVNVLVIENKLSEAQGVLSTAVADEASMSGRPPVELEIELAQLDIATNQPQLAYPIFLQVLQDNSGRVDAWSGLISALHLMGHDGDAVAQEKVMPIDARVQLEAMPGFQQMMTAMENLPAARTSTGGPAYTPFIPSVASTVAQPAPVVSPAVPAVSTMPRYEGPQHAIVGPEHSQSPISAPVKPSTARQEHTQAAPKSIAAVPSRVPRVQADVSQTATATSSSSGSGIGVPLVTQPATKPIVHSGEEIPDTGEQQYPQPRVRPRTTMKSASASASAAGRQ